MVESVYEFPEQKVSWSEKQKEKWYANCIDYVISKGLSFNNRKETETKISILRGNIPNEFYKKKVVIIPGFKMKLALFGRRFVSRKFLRKITYNIQKSKEK